MVPVRWKEGRKEGRACPWVEVGKLRGQGSSCDTRVPRNASLTDQRGVGGVVDRQTDALLEVFCWSWGKSSLHS